MSTIGFSIIAAALGLQIVSVSLLSWLVWSRWSEQTRQTVLWRAMRDEK